MFACWFQLELISQPTVFFSHNKPAPAGFISAETNQRTGWLFMILSFCLSSFYPIYMISYLAKYVGLKSYDVFGWTNHCDLKTIILLKSSLEFLKPHSWSCFFFLKEGFACSFQPCLDLLRKIENEKNESKKQTFGF